MVVSIGGHVLVVGHDAFKLHTQTNTTAPNVGMSDVYWSDGQQMLPTSGSLKGTLEARDKILVGQLTGLNSLASELTSQVNTIHRSGFDMNDVAGKDFFTVTAGSEAGTIAVNTLLDAAGVVTSKNQFEPGNNTVALEMVALKNSKIAASPFNGDVTLNEYYNTQITSLAVSTQRAIDNTYQHGLVAKALSDQRESVAGVNLDEEAANMAKTQKAYQAAARMLTTMDELLDLVINRMGLTGR